MELQYLHLEPKRAFHFGQRGVGVESSTEFAPSDTIFSALCSVLLAVESKRSLEEFLKRFTDGEPPLLLGCGFPYVLCSGEPLRFYPAPLSWQALDQRDIRRKTRWISESIFSLLVVSDSAVDVEYLEAVEALVTRTERRMLESEYSTLVRLNHGRLPLWTVDDVPRVAVDRLSSASAVYRAGCLSFASGGGIWIGVVPIDVQWTQNRLLTFTDVLSEQGLGGERSSGYGAFTHRREFDLTFTLPDIHAGDRFVTLSYYSPNLASGEQSVFTQDSAFIVDARRGWMSSPDNSALRRKAARMIRFGSVLRATGENRVYGQLVDVKPDVFTQHSVWRYGFALPVPIRD